MTTEVPSAKPPRLAALVGLVGFGLLLGTLCLAAGWLVIGMGHGWDLPQRLGVLSLLLYPLALTRLAWIARTTPWPQDATWTLLALAILLLLAIGLDVMPPPPPVEALGWLALALLAALYWLGGHLLEPSGWQAAWGDGALLALGLALDLRAWVAFVDPNELHPAGLIGPWLVLWLGWQAVAGLALVRHLRGRTNPA